MKKHEPRSINVKTKKEQAADQFIKVMEDVRAKMTLAGGAEMLTHFKLLTDGRTVKRPMTSAGWQAGCLDPRVVTQRGLPSGRPWWLRYRAPLAKATVVTLRPNPSSGRYEQHVRHVSSAQLKLF